MMANNKALFEDVKAYNQDVIKLMQESNNAMSKEVTETVKKVTKKAA